MILGTSQIPLDDFWADQHYLPATRPIDGPELVRHDKVRLDGVLLVILRAQLVEVFCGGRSVSFRLPIPPQTVSASDVKPLGWFVEDGVVEMIDISIHRL